MDQRVILKPGKEKSLHRRHPWVFSGAVQSAPSFSNGDLLPIYDSAGAFLAQGFFHNQNSIAGRVLCFDRRPPETVIFEKINNALTLRKKLFDPKITNAYRLINAEGDGLSGLIVDVYDHVVVLQISTYGMERFKSCIVESLVSHLKPKSIYEKSSSSSRTQEGLELCTGVLYGENIPEVLILENGIPFYVPIAEGQKTGFFLDQRSMRAWVGAHAEGKRVLNCFSYTGGFSLYALRGGATHVDSVDVSPLAAIFSAKNGHPIIQTDVFDFIKTSPLNYDLIILDPPAFAKKRADVIQACQGYKEMNRTVLGKMPPDSFLVTASCSYFIDGPLFQNLLFQAACEAKRNVRIVGRHIQAPDHPISLDHPEGDYLKSLVLYIE